jgi:hypothetical protein
MWPRKYVGDSNELTCGALRIVDHPYLVHVVLNSAAVQGYVHGALYKVRYRMRRRRKRFNVSHFPIGFVPGATRVRFFSFRWMSKQCLMSFLLKASTIPDSHLKLPKRDLIAHSGISFPKERISLPKAGSHCPKRDLTLLLIPIAIELMISQCAT